MKVIIDFPDAKQGSAFLKQVKANAHVAMAKRMTATEAEVLEQLAEILHVHRIADQIDSGKIATRPASALLQELRNNR